VARLKRPRLSGTRTRTRTIVLAAALAVIVAAGGVLVALHPGVTGRLLHRAATATHVKGDARTRPHLGGTLTVALPVGSPLDLDPAFAVQPGERTLAASLFTGLTRLDPDGTVRPAVAAAWSSDASLRRWRFTLRPGVRFSDGTSIQAADVKFAWERLASPKLKPQPSPLAYLLDPVAGYQAFASGHARAISGISAPDAGTLQVDLSQPDADFPTLVASPSLAPLPRTLAANDPTGFVADPVGEGPFKLTRRPQKGQPLDLLRNPATAGATAYLDHVRIVLVPDEQTAWLTFQHGQVQAAPIPTDQLTAAKTIEGTAVLQAPVATTWSLNFNLRVKPFTDPRWRHAIALAINRPSLATAFAGTRTLAPGIVPDPIPGATHTTCPACTYDPTRARALLTQLNRTAAPTSLTLAIPATAADERIATLLAADLQAIGITLKLQPVPPASYLSVLAAKQPSLHLFTLPWTGDPPLPDTFLSTQFATHSPRNLTGYANATTDTLLTQAHSTADTSTRTRLYQQAESTILTQTPTIPLLEARSNFAVTHAIEGATITPTGALTLATISLAT
jgi:ABC-type transport system substrate-binding protein